MAKKLKSFADLPAPPKKRYRRRHGKPPKGANHSLYVRIYRQVDGAIQNAIDCHPTWFILEDKDVIRRSITKRVTGSLTGLLINEILKDDDGSSESVNGKARALNGG